MSDQLFHFETAATPGEKAKRCAACIGTGAMHPGQRDSKPCAPCCGTGWIKAPNHEISGPEQGPDCGMSRPTALLA